MRNNALMEQMLFVHIRYRELQSRATRPEARGLGGLQLKYQMEAREVRLAFIGRKELYGVIAAS